MTSVIIRELLDNIKSFRFIMLLLFSIILFSVNGIVFPEKYYQEQSLIDTNSKFYSSNGLALRIFPKLSPLQFLAEGGDKYRHKEYHLTAGGMIRPQSIAQPESGLPNIPELDWTFIIKNIFSLYIILMGYNAISDEKKHGILGLIFSNPMSRVKFLLAKYCIIITSVSIPLLIGMTFNILIVGNQMPEILTATTFLKLLLMLFTTIAYLSIFTLLSLMISSLINQSSLALMILMVAWITFALAEDIAGIVAKKIATVPREIDIAIEFSSNYIFDNLKDFGQRADRGDFESKEEVIREHEQIYIDGQLNYNRHINDSRNAINHRVNFARHMSLFSPTSLMQFASESIAGTGIQHDENFLDDVQGYSIIYDNFIMSKIGKLPLEYNFVGQNFSVFLKDETVSLRAPKATKRNFEDEDVPVFRESETSFFSALHDVLLYLSILLLWNIIFAIGSFVAFTRADLV